MLPSRASGNRERGRPLGERVKPDGSRSLEFGKGPQGAGWWGAGTSAGTRDNCATGCVGARSICGGSERFFEGSPPSGRFSSADFLPMELEGSRSRSFRAGWLWAWNFALDENALTAVTRHLPAAVRSGKATQPPSNLRLWLGATMSLGMWAYRMRDGYALTTDLTQGGWQQREEWARVAEPELIGLPRAAISTPPFVIVLTDATVILLRHGAVADGRPWRGKPAWGGHCSSRSIDVPAGRPEHVVRYDDIAVLQPQDLTQI